MTAVIGGISVFVDDDTSRFQQSMTRNAALVEQQTQRMTRALGGTAKSVDDLNQKASHFQPDAFRALSISALRAQNSVERLQKTMLALAAVSGGGFAGAFALKTLTDTADRYTNIQNRIAAVVTGNQERVQTEQQIFDAAQRTRGSFEAMATLYSRLTLSATQLGASQGQILQVVETTQKALTLAGATTGEANSAAIQLTQALGAGRLQGDELRAILENAPILAQAIAKEFNVSVGELKAMGTEGTLLADRVFKAILNASGDIDTKFKEIRPTVASALQVLDNAFTKYIGGVDQSIGASQRMALGIISLSDNLHVLGDTLSVVGPLLAAVFANRAVQRLGGGIAAPFKAEAQARQAALDEARLVEQRASERVVNAGAKVAAVRSEARTNVESFADPALLRDRERARKEIEAIDKATAASGERQRSLAQRLSEVNITAGRAGEAAAAREAKAIDNLSAKLTRELELKRTIEQANTMATLRAASASVGAGSERAVTAAERDLGKLKAELDRIRNEAIPRAKAEAGSAAIAVAKTATDAEAKDLAARVALGRKIAEERAGNADLLARRALTSAVGKNIEGEIQHSAVANGAKVLGDAYKESSTAAAGYALAQQGVATATARVGLVTTATATIVNLARTGFASLIGFLGGPLGAAVTAAAVGWGIYEISQARARAEQEKFTDAVTASATVMKQLRDAQASGGVPAALSAANLNLSELQPGFQRSLDEMVRSLPIVSNSLRGLVPEEARSRLGELQAAIFEVQRKGGDAKPAIEALIAELERLSGVSPDVSKAVSAMLTLARTALSARNAIASLSTEASLAKSGIGDNDDARDAQNRRARAEQARREAFATQGLQDLAGTTALPAVPKLVAEQAAKKLTDAADKDAERTRLELHDQVVEIQKNAGGTLTYEQALATARKVNALSEATGKQAKTDAEKFEDALKRLQEQGRASFFTDVDRELIDELKKMKGSNPELLKNTVNALNAGTALPDEAQQVRAAILLKDAGKEYRNLLTQYGTAEQIMPGVRDQQEKLNAAVAAGKITSQQAALGMADYLGKFQNFKWIDSLANSLEQFGTTLADSLYDGKLNADAFKSAINSLGKEIFKLAVSETILTPLKNSLRSILSETAGAGFSLSSLIGAFTGGGATPGSSGLPATMDLPPVRPAVLHRGGSPIGAPTRLMDARAFDNAPRFHSGRLGPREITAILERDETVLTGRQSRGLGAMMAGVGNMQPGGMHVTINEAPGTQAQATQTGPRDLHIDIVGMMDNAMADRIAHGRGATAKVVRGGVRRG